MSFLRRLLMGLQIVNQLLPGIIEAGVTGRARVRALRVVVGSTYGVAGAGPAFAPGDSADDLVITVR